MKISEVIKELNYLLEEEGDINVVITTATRDFDKGEEIEKDRLLQSNEIFIRVDEYEGEPSEVNIRNFSH